MESKRAVGGSWHIVWCNERCHKQEWDSFRKAATESARAAGAMLTCFKKAAVFDRWLAHAGQTPFVLFTNWREVKPCLQHVADRGGAWPMLTIVHCESRDHMGRILSWAEGLPANFGPVRVSTELGSPQDFVTDLLEVVGTHAALAPALVDTDTVAERPASTDALKSESDQQQLDGDLPTARSDRCQPSAGKVPPAAAAAVGCKTAQGPAASVPTVAGLGGPQAPRWQGALTEIRLVPQQIFFPAAVPPAVADMLAPILAGCPCPKQLEHMLLGAQPDMYLD